MLFQEVASLLKSHFNLDNPLSKVVRHLSRCLLQMQRQTQALGKPGSLL